jgi:hypothetical protein
MKRNIATCRRVTGALHTVEVHATVHLTIMTAEAALNVTLAVHSSSSDILSISAAIAALHVTLAVHTV